MRRRHGFDTLLAALATLVLFIAAFPARRPAIVSAQPPTPPRAAPLAAAGAGADLARRHPAARLVAGSRSASSPTSPPTAFWPRRQASLSTRCSGCFRPRGAGFALWPVRQSRFHRAAGRGPQRCCPGWRDADRRRRKLHSLASQGHQALGLGLIVGLAIALWSAESGDEGALRLAQRGVQRDREAELPQAHRHHARLHPRGHRVLDRGADGRRRHPHRAAVSSACTARPRRCCGSRAGR